MVADNSIGSFSAKTPIFINLLYKSSKSALVLLHSIFNILGENALNSEVFPAPGVLTTLLILQKFSSGIICNTDESNNDKNSVSLDICSLFLIKKGLFQIILLLPVSCYSRK